MREVRFEIAGDAVAQARPRFAVHGGHAVAFDKKESREYKAYVKMLAVKAMGGQPPIAESGVSVELVVIKRVPKTFSKRKRLEAVEGGAIRPLTKPDVDNVAKAILDAFKGVVWMDDSQVVDLSISKWYGESPCTRVAVKEVCGA